MQLTHGDLILVSGRGFGARCIQIATGSTWHHTENVIKEGGELYVIGATWPRVRKTYLREYLNRGGKTFLFLRAQAAPPEDYATRLNEALGRRFDWLAIWWQFVYHLTGRRRWRGQNEARATKSLYCSELSAYAHARPNWWAYWPGAFETDPHFTQITE
jgi:hypothetical protein